MRAAPFFVYISSPKFILSMRNTLLSAMACLTMAFAPVQAQNNVKTTDGNVTVYNFNQPITICGEDAILAANFFSVSGNGEYAVAYDDQFSGASFLWTRST